MFVEVDALHYQRPHNQAEKTQHFLRSCSWFINESCAVLLTECHSSHKHEGGGMGK